MVIIIGLIGLLISGKVEINKKTKETVVSSKTLEEESDLKKAIKKVYDSVVYIQVEAVNNRTFGGLQVASGLRSSKRRIFGVFAYAGIRITAERLEVA